MKTLLTILLLSVATGEGQTKVYVPYSRVLPEGFTFVVPKSTRDTIVTSEDHLVWAQDKNGTTRYCLEWPDILSAWDEYKDTCWADSTGYKSGEEDAVANEKCRREVDSINALSTGNRYRGFLACLTQYLTKYTHRTPTLEGFMEFLRRKK
jgi:hypothetical protein